MQDKQVLVFHGEGLQLPAPSQCYEIVENTNMCFFYVSLNNTANKELRFDLIIVWLCSLFQLNLRGYNDKQHVLLQRVMEKMTNFEIDPQRFEVLKENVSWPFVPWFVNFQYMICHDFS